tara:strand:+ start:3508 stop:4227 length:720 start_codon:yes stop_codon:yes gene_type:complete
MSKSVIHLENASIGFSPDNPLIKNLNLDVNQGEIVAIAGPSGIGKTTLLRTIAGLVPMLDGEMTLFGRNSKASRGELGYIPQRLGLIRHASVYHNVLLGALTSTAGAWFPFSFEARRRTLESIDAMGISEKKRTPIRLLSGGQQRRVATARTLAQQPSIILADEFLGELDEETMESVLSKVTNYVRTNNATLIVVEHDISRAKRMADHLLILDDGQLNPFVDQPIAMQISMRLDKELDI